MLLLTVIVFLCSSTALNNALHQRGQPSCGERFVSEEAKRIVGGSQSQVGAWPWQAALLFNGSHVCGGSLISSEWVVSAAHCFLEIGFKTTADQWQVVLGEHHLKNEEWFEQSRSVRAIYTHPNFKASKEQAIDQDTVLSMPPDYDLVLLRLSEPVNFNRLVFPICLLPLGVRFYKGKECYVTGWGNLKWKGPKAIILREAKVRLVNQEKCNGIMSYNGQIHERALCAGFEQGGVDACQHDSGGPLACEHEGRWYLTGVVSWGHQCGQPHKYGVYADMEDMTQWVIDTINHNH